MAGQHASAPSSPLLEVSNLVVKYGTQTAVDDLSFSVPRGQFVALLGPSGCGKTTTLRAIAGLERVTAGTISIGGVVAADTKHHKPPEKRELNMVFQSYAVWPHLTVFDNVAYGLKQAKISREETRQRTADVLTAVGLSGLEKRLGTELSGGQQQRVALARALATRPRIVLYDEPLSNLDAGLREQVRNQIVELHERFRTTSIFVTHDQSEALAMADTVVVMNDGRAQQISSPRNLYQRPDNEFVAGFVGVMNICPAVVEEMSSDPDRAVVRLEQGPGLRLLMENAPRMPSRQGERGNILLRPESLVLVQDGAATEIPMNRWTGSVRRISFVGPRVECEVVLGDWPLRAELPGTVAVDAGETRQFYVPPSSPVWLPKD